MKNWLQWILPFWMVNQKMNVYKLEIKFFKNFLIKKWNKVKMMKIAMKFQKLKKSIKTELLMKNLNSF